MLSHLFEGKQAGRCGKAQKREEDWAVLSQKAAHSVPGSAVGMVEVCVEA